MIKALEASGIRADVKGGWAAQANHATEEEEGSEAGRQPKGPHLGIEDVRIQRAKNLIGALVGAAMASSAVASAGQLFLGKVDRQEVSRLSPIVGRSGWWQATDIVETKIALVGADITQRVGSSGTTLGCSRRRITRRTGWFQRNHQKG